jgi:hypothetical protein
MTRGLRSLFYIAVAGGVSACDVSVADVQVPTGATLTTVTASVEYPSSFATLCKDGPEGFTYSFTLSQEAGPGGTLGTFLEGTEVELTGGECKDVWRKDSPPSDVGPVVSDVPVTLTFTENEPPAGTFFVSAEATGAIGTPDVDLATRTVTAQANLFHDLSVTFYNELEPEIGLEGCTPGFWKNTKLDWPIDEDTDFNTYFGVDFLPGKTLGDAIGLGGGGYNALARHATAAALNIASGVDYPISLAELQALVQEGTEAAKDTLDGYNNLGCPLSNGKQ